MKIAALAVVLAAFVAGCRQDAPTAPAAAKQLIVVASGDAMGWITPCGCASGQSGGLLRRGSLVKQEQANGDVVVVDVGGAAAGTSDYQKTKFEAMLAGEKAMELSAQNVGLAEAKLGAAYLAEVAKRLDAPLISANLRDGDGKPVLPGYRMVTAAGQRLLIVGVLSPKYAAELPGLTVSDPRAAVLQLANEQKGKFDRLVVLAYLPEAELTALATALPEADLVLGGPTVQNIPPRKVGPVTLAAATAKGKFVLRLALDPARPADGWSGELIGMTESWSDEPLQSTNLQSFHAKLAAMDYESPTTGLAPAPPPGAPAGFRFAGSEACQNCHKADDEIWARSKHAHAWQTLVTKGYQMDSSCQVCHTTGYGQPGGFVSIKKSQALVNVGCENCHGPSQAHSENPTGERTPWKAGEACLRCHDHENSPQFDFKAYWPRIAHGRK